MLARKKVIYQPFSVCTTLEDVRRQRRITKAYYIKQKLLGLLMLVIGIISLFTVHDGTFFMMSILIGLYLVFTQQKVTIFRKG